MQVKHLARSIIVSLAALTAVQASSWAALRLGNLQINPFMELKRVYDTNIYLDSDSLKSSLIKNFSPGIGLYLPVQKHEFRLNYQADFFWYDENPSLNSATHSNADLLAKLNFPVGLSFTAKDSYRDTTDPAQREDMERTKRKQNTVDTVIGYAFNRYGINLGYSQTLHNYQQADFKPLYDRREGETNLELFYNVSPKTSVVVDYGLGTVAYMYATNNNSSQYTQIRAGLRGQLTPKTVGELKIGSKARTYDTVTGKDVTTSVASLSSLTTFSEKTNLNLSALRNLAESTLDANNLYYVATGFGLKLNHKIEKDLFLGLNGMYESDDYPAESTIDAITQKRQDANIQGGFDITYRAFEWMNVAIGYTMRQRNSNFNKFDFTDNIQTLNVKILY